MIEFDEDYDLKGTIITMGNAETTRVPPRKTPLITVQLKPSVMVQTYQQRSTAAIKNEESREYKTVMWTYQQNEKGKMINSVIAHGMTR